MLSQLEKNTSGVPQGSILGPLLFILFFNDLSTCLEHCEIIKHANDTILFVSDKDFCIIESKLSQDMAAIDTWCQENDLILNLNKGKTEAMMFGTNKSLKSHPSLNVCYQHNAVEVTKSYKYLGVEIDSTLNLNTQFKKSYKRACSRLRLLSKIRALVNIKAAKSIYQMMIIPIITYYCIVQLKHNQEHRLSSLHDRAQKIIMKNDLPSITNIIKKRAYIFVRKCLDETV